MPPDEQNLAAERAAIARASRRARQHPNDLVRAETLTHLRRDYYERVLAAHIQQVVAAAPELTPEQRSRLAVLLQQPSGGNDATR